jgi:hypothetical protein
MGYPGLYPGFSIIGTALDVFTILNKIGKC